MGEGELTHSHRKIGVSSTKKDQFHCFSGGIPASTKIQVEGFQLAMACLSDISTIRSNLENIGCRSMVSTSNDVAAVDCPFSWSVAPEILPS